MGDDLGSLDAQLGGMFDSNEPALKREQTQAKGSGPVDWSTMKTHKSGYLLNEAASCLQKAIRRGEEELAYRMAIDIAEGHMEYLWRRLLVISSEDIGLADPDMTGRIWLLKQAFDASKSSKAKQGAIEILAQAVLMMARSPKSREVDDFHCSQDERIKEGWRPEIPDWAMDEHTSGGKAMGRRSFSYFAKHGCLVRNRTGTNRYEGWGGEGAPWTEEDGLPEPFDETVGEYRADVFKGEFFSTVKERRAKYGMAPGHVCEWDDEAGLEWAREHCRCTEADGSPLDSEGDVECLEPDSPRSETEEIVDDDEEEWF